MQMRTPKQPLHRHREKQTDSEQVPQTKEKRHVPVDVIISAGEVISHLRTLLSYEMFKNRKDKADAELSISKLEAALKK